MFSAHFDSLGKEQQEVARELRVTPSTVYYWRRGSRPRDAKVLARVERWSKGKVPASAKSSHPAHGDAA